MRAIWTMAIWASLSIGAVGFRFDGAEAMQFHVAHAEVDFKKPIKPDELIDARVRTERIGNSSMTVLVELHGTGDQPDLRAVIREVQVHVDLATHSPVPIPDAVKDQFRAFDAREGMIHAGEGVLQEA
jgi:acyl-CoA thioester hydrolase